MSEKEERHINTQTTMLLHLYNLIGRNLGLDHIAEEKIKAVIDDRKHPVQEWTHRMKDNHTMELETKLLLDVQHTEDAQHPEKV